MMMIVVVLVVRMSSSARAYTCRCTRKPTRPRASDAETRLGIAGLHRCLRAHRREPRQLRSWPHIPVTAMYRFGKGAARAPHRRSCCLRERRRRSPDPLDTVASLLSVRACMRACKRACVFPHTDACRCAAQSVPLERNTSRSG